MNTREIYKQSWKLSVTEPTAWGLFMLFWLASMITTALSPIIPIVGSIIASFLILVYNGCFIVNLEHTLIERNGEKVSFKDLDLKKYISVFIKFMILTIVATILFTISAFAIIVYIVDKMGHIEGFYFTSILISIILSILPIMIAFILFVVIMNVIMGATILPRVYITTKFNECEKDDLKEIHDIFKEEGLFKKALKLELMKCAESIIITILMLILSLYVSALFVTVLWVYMLLSTIKLNTARTLLYNDLCNSISIEIK